MATPAELEAIMRKILNDEFPSIAKYVQFEQDARFGAVRYTNKYMIYNSVICPKKLRTGDLAKFRRDMTKYSEYMEDLITNGEQVCRECRHYLDKYKYLATMIPFCDFSGMKLPTRMKCVHIIQGFGWKYIDNVHRREHLCRELRILPLPIANEIMMYVK